MVIKELDNNLIIKYKDLKIEIDTAKEDSRSKEESLLGDETMETYSCMCLIR